MAIRKLIIALATLLALPFFLSFLIGSFDTGGFMGSKISSSYNILKRARDGSVAHGLTRYAEQHHGELPKSVKELARMVLPLSQWESRSSYVRRVTNANFLMTCTIVSVWIAVVLVCIRFSYARLVIPVVIGVTLFGVSLSLMDRRSGCEYLDCYKLLDTPVGPPGKQIVGFRSPIEDSDRVCILVQWGSDFWNQYMTAEEFRALQIPE